MSALEPGWQRWAAIALGVVAVVGPLVAPNDYWIGVMARICLYATLALGLNIVVGFAGLLDLGYVAFYAVGAYTTAMLTTESGWTAWEALPVAIVVAMIAGVMLGAPTLRLRGDYLAIVTLGFGEIVRLVALNSTALKQAIVRSRHIALATIESSEQPFFPEGLAPLGLPHTVSRAPARDADPGRSRREAGRARLRQHGQSRRQARGPHLAGR